MTRHELTADTVLSRPIATERDAFLRAVYGWMAGGLAVTAVTAWLTASSPALINAATSGPLFWILVVAQLGMVVVLSGRVDRLSASTASTLFLVYSGLTGVTLSCVLLIFTGESVATTFVITAGMFAALATYGATTERRLSGLGQFLFMGLIGVVLASVVGVFWHNDALQFVISLAGVIVFSGLAVYDAKRLNEMADVVPRGHAGAYAVSGALALYLDFVNLFLSLLRFVGRRRE